MNKNTKIFLSGHNGSVGSAILNKLKEEKFRKIFTIDKKKLNLTDQYKTYKFLKNLQPDWVIICAAKAGGIAANKKYSAEILHDNLVIQSNLVHGSYLAGVKNLIFFASSSVYPRLAKQPFKETSLLKGSLEPTTEAYAMAKLAGIKMCEIYSKQYKLNYITLVPCNVFGLKDKFDQKNSHFIPALIKKIDNLKKKKILKLWGNGKSMRQIIFSEDVADACLYFMKKKFKEKIINIGSKINFTIKDYAKIIMKILNVKAKIVFYNKHLNGMPKKELDLSVANKLGWKSKTNFNTAILKSYNAYKKIKL